MTEAATFREKVPMSFGNGLIRVSALNSQVAGAVVDELEGLEWQPAMVAMKHDVYRVRELVDRTQRDALSVGASRAEGILNRLMGEVRESALSAVRECWGLDLRRTSSPQLTQYTVGHFIRAHRDSGEAFRDRMFSAVTYLNADYQGGEIAFPAIPASFHPPVGETLIFPSDFVHEVRPIVSGRKFVFLFFVDRGI